MFWPNKAGVVNVVLTLFLKVLWFFVGHHVCLRQQCNLFFFLNLGRAPSMQSKTKVPLVVSAECSVSTLAINQGQFDELHWNSVG